MLRKKVSGPIRDKERTIQKMINSVGRILKTKGHKEITVTNVSKFANVDKKLVYNYFGGIEKLSSEYVKSQDYWSKNDLIKEEMDFDDGGNVVSKTLLINQFNELRKNKELQKILLWELSESKPFLKKIADNREDIGEEMFKSITDPHFGELATTYRGVIALVISGIYYLNMHTSINGSKFCGIDLRTDEGSDQIQESIQFLIDKIYE